MKMYVLGLAAYVVATFATQAVSHFALNADHYAAVSYMRTNPIFSLGVLSMVIQGAGLCSVYARLAGHRPSLWRALGFSWAMGAFLVSYISLAEAAKYAVPSTASWIAVEALAGFVQFSIFGALLFACISTS